MAKLPEATAGIVILVAALLCLLWLLHFGGLSFTAWLVGVVLALLVSMVWGARRPGR